MQIDQEAFEYAIGKIDDGHIFERFSHNFLSASLGYNFIPVGGTKDKGVDGFQHIFHRSGFEKMIFQISTELGHEEKIRSTILKLKTNKIEYSKLFYVTNRKINNSQKFIDSIYEEFEIHLTIFDIKWFVSNCNSSEKTIKAYQIFVDTYLHEYSKPGKQVSIANIAEDSRLFVFLGQQFAIQRKDLKLDDLLAETLILFSLEGTDPDKNIVKKEDEIKNSIKKYLKFDPQLISEKITERLQHLTKKPRKIIYHSKLEGYCLPHSTRVEISERNLKDELLYEAFFTETKEVIKKYFKDGELKIKDVEGLIKNVFNNIFQRQGLEFSNFVLKGDSHSVVEQNLNDVIAEAVDKSPVVNKEKVKTALHLAIRDIVYNGTETQRKFLKSLSNTYLMMFLLHWEPKLSTYFQSLASQLKVFVDNSVIIPALSEKYLSEGNRRHWNLLVGAKNAGISLFINETLLDELIAHFRMITTKYYNVFKNQESYYLGDEYELMYIEEILIRSYFYAKRKRLVKDFFKFIDNFIDPGLRDAKRELINYLKDTFGIEFISNQAWDIKLNTEDLNKLTEVLTHQKESETKAKNDAAMILSIYHLREKNNETSESGIFGYKTWWLSKDTMTYKAINQCFGATKYPVSCYIRPDFIYNYIALKPTSDEVKDAYDEIFPTMLGVNLSYHLPRGVADAVQEKIKEYHDKSPQRVKQIISNLSDRLKSDPALRNRNSVVHFLDTELKKINNGQA